MDAHPSPHPTAETLESYGLGTLDDALAEEVARHLEDCPACRRRVAEAGAIASWAGSATRGSERKHRPRLRAIPRMDRKWTPSERPGIPPPAPSRPRPTGSRGRPDRRSPVATVRSAARTGGG